MTNSHEHYGLDAPVVVRNLGVAGMTLIVASMSLTDDFHILKLLLLISGLCLMSTAAWMVISSLWLKKRVMRALLNDRRWQGDESVLDIGCGRGLVTIGAAKRSPRGHICAIDLWASEDLSGNGPDALIANARAARVEERLTIATGDARKLPYADASYDVVTSMTALISPRLVVRVEC